MLSVLQSFTLLGGLQLDRDVRNLVSAAGELTTKPVRDKFARLTQVRGHGFGAHKHIFISQQDQCWCLKRDYLISFLWPYCLAAG